MEEDLDEKETVEENVEEDDVEYYNWNMIPITYPEEKKTGVTFKGDTEECFKASKKIFKREWLNVGTVPTFKMHNVGTVPTYKMHNVGTVPTYKMHNIGTVPMFKMHNIGTQIF